MGPELNRRQWQHLSARSRICQCHWYKGNTEGEKGTQRAALFQAFVGCNLLGSFVAINKKVEASCVHGLDDISQILWSPNFLQVSPKFLSWNTVVGSKEVQKSSEHLHFFFFVVARKRKIIIIIKRGWLVFLVGQKPKCESGIWCSARAQSINKSLTTFAKSL